MVGAIGLCNVSLQPTPRHNRLGWVGFSATSSQGFISQPNSFVDSNEDSRPFSVLPKALNSMPHFSKPATRILQITGDSCPPSKKETARFARDPTVPSL